MGTATRRRRGGVRKGVVAIALVAALATQGAVPADATWWSKYAPSVVSQGFSGAQSDDDSGNPRTSDDGRYVVFMSDATNLTGSPLTSGHTAVYWRDRVTGETLRASEPTAGVAAINRGARDGQISGCGRYVLFFTGLALAPEDVNGGQDYYVRDMETGEFRWIDFRGDGSAVGSSAHDTRFAADGSYFVFESGNGDLLGTGKTTVSQNVWGYDLVSNEATLVSAPPVADAVANRGSRDSAISGDGRYVAFLTGNGWSPQDTNDNQDIYVRDMDTGEFRWIDFRGDGTALGRDVSDIHISADGSRVAFESSSAILSGDTMADRDVYSYSLASDEATLVSGPHVDTSTSFTPSLSADGRYVMFNSRHAFAAEDTNGAYDIYLKDMQTGDFTRVPVMGRGGFPADFHESLRISSDGRHLVFHTGAGLVPTDTNGRYDVYHARVMLEGLLEEAGAERLKGDDRYATAVTLSKRAFPDGAESVVLATGEDWPDALSGAVLAGAIDGPVLLTRKKSIPADVKAEITRLGVENVYIIGGYGAISAAVEIEIDQMVSGYVWRLAGVDRYATSRVVAARAIQVLGSEYDGGVTIATGTNFPDAVAAAPLAAGVGWPTILVKPEDASVKLPARARSAIIAGGTGAFGSGMETYLEGVLDSANVDRRGGANRYETAAMLAETGVGAGLLWNGAGIATGENFPDALTGGVGVGLNRSTMLLTPADSLHPATRQALAANADRIDSIAILGGTGAISDAVRLEIVELLFPF